VVVIDAPKERALLSLLALRDGAAVASGDIIDALWGADPPRSARKAVQTYIANLRRVLPSDVIVTAADGYLLSCDEVDVASFEHLIHDSRRMAKPASAIKALSSALALWRGPALPDLAGQRLGAVEAARLDELRRAAEEDLADLRLAHGEHNVLIADLEAAVAAEPLRERRWAQLTNARLVPRRAAKRRPARLPAVTGAFGRQAWHRAGT
jgi:DNA-binding SARP family transcriptional activator